MFRSSPPEVFSSKDTIQKRSEPAGEPTRRSAISTKSLCNFIEITFMEECIPENSHYTCKNLSPGEHFWETPPVCQNSFEILKL